MNKSNIKASFFANQVAQLSAIRDVLSESQTKPRRLLAVATALATICAVNGIAWYIVGMDFETHGLIVALFAGALAGYASYAVSHAQRRADKEAIHSLVLRYEPLNKYAYQELLGRMPLDQDLNVVAVQTWLVAETRKINELQYPLYSAWQEIYKVR